VRLQLTCQLFDDLSKNSPALYRVVKAARRALSFKEE
jgi:hypothetical protein